MSKPTIKIAVVSDVVCPWCYIGKRRIEKAIAQLSNEFQFELAYYPFELNPDMPADGKNQVAYLSDKFGGIEEYERITAHTAEVAATEGLAFDFPKQKVSPNTLNAHRLILFAKERGKDLILVERLFKAYFTEGIDLSKNENLLALATEVGLEPESTSVFLQSKTGITEVRLAEKELQQMGIRSVPFYIINDKYGVSGAQATETFVQAFRNIEKELQNTGEACDVDAKNC
jgi:predicted DsbA family dithiol-disulfide isomerase